MVVKPRVYAVYDCIVVARLCTIRGHRLYVTPSPERHTVERLTSPAFAACCATAPGCRSASSTCRRFAEQQHTRRVACSRYH